MQNRLDLKDVHIQRARELDVKLASGTDAHSVEQLEFMRFAIGIAYRWWFEADDVLNTWPVKKLMKFLHREVNGYKKRKT